MRFTHLMLAAWCVAVLCICLCDMGGATAQLEGQEKPAIKTAYAQEAYGGSCPSDIKNIVFRGRTASCLRHNKYLDYISVISDSSRCFSSPDTLTLYEGSTVTAICAEVHCNQNTGTYSISVKNGRQSIDCPAGATVALNLYSPVFKSGSITCPPYPNVCDVVVSGAMSNTRYSVLTMLGLLVFVIVSAVV